MTPPENVALENIDEAFAEYGPLIAKPARDGSSYGLILVNAKQDLVAVRNAAKHEDYVIEPYIAASRRPAACWSAPTARSSRCRRSKSFPGEGNFDYAAKYLLKSTP